MSRILLKCLEGGKRNGAVLPSAGMAGKGAGVEDSLGLRHGSISTWSPWQSSVLLDFALVEKLGIFCCFLEVCLGISCPLCVRCRKHIPTRPGSVFVGSKASSAAPKPSLQGRDQVRVIFKAAPSLLRGLSIGE